MKLVATNKTVLRDYNISDKFEAGIVLKGTEVKSLRLGRASLAGSFVKMDKGEAFVVNMHIPEYEYGNIFNHDPVRKRKLILHRREIDKLSGALTRKGFSIIPLRIYFRGGLAKLEIALGKGKKMYDKRADLKKKQIEREMRRAVSR